jgi:hypothetical protein
VGKKESGIVVPSVGETRQSRLDPVAYLGFFSGGGGGSTNSAVDRGQRE